MNRITLPALFAFCFFVGFGFVLRNLPEPPCANSLTCVESLETHVENESTAIFQGQELAVPSINLEQEALLADLQEAPDILGVSDPEELLAAAAEKHIYVDLSTQTLYAYEGNDQYFSTLVSTGKWGRTPTGDFTIWVKIRATKMSGGSGNDYYYLPNVPYVMFFYNSDIPKARGYGLHGTYWHNNFGHEMSHGCVNLRTVDAQKLYEWTTPVVEANTTHATKENPGTPITICNQLEIREGQTPVCLE